MTADDADQPTVDADIDVFAIATRGLEDICVDEIDELDAVSISEQGYRRITARCPPESLASLLQLRTVDDVFLDLATWDEIGHQRAVLGRLTTLASGLDTSRATSTCRLLRDIPDQPTIHVTASFVGTRNYSTDEIRAAVGAGLASATGWTLAEDHRDADIDIRVFIEHERTFVGMRLGAQPLQVRPYKVREQKGALKPPVAAAMVRMTSLNPGATICDPFCGSGTIAIEAGLQGLCAIGFDVDPAAGAAARANAEQADIDARIASADARHLPIGSNSMNGVVTNPPWGRQVTSESSLASLYADAFREMQRVLVPGAPIVMLTSHHDLLAPFAELLVAEREISLFGQRPRILTFRNSA